MGELPARAHVQTGIPVQEGWNHAQRNQPCYSQAGGFAGAWTISNANLMQALDKLNQRYGRDTVKVSTQGAFKDWQMRQEHKSSNYTTCWQDIPTV